jgi:mediator of RNA polymerase II transcription subunit 13
MRSALQAVTLALRSAGCLVSLEASTRKLWIFSNNSQFECLDPISTPMTGEAVASIVIQGLELKPIIVSRVSSSELAESFLSPENQPPTVGPVPNGTDSGIGGQLGHNLNDRAATLNGQTADTSAPGSKLNEDKESQIEQTEREDVYASLIHAITSSISLRLSRTKGFTPLNARDLVLSRPSVSGGFDEEMDDSRRKPSLVASILSLQVELAATGFLVISYNLSSQPRLGFLAADISLEEIVSLSQRNLNLWLAPFGRAARMTGNPPAAAYAPGSKQVSPTISHGLEARRDAEVRQGVLKSYILRRLENHGLNVTEMQDGTWVEVETLTFRTSPPKIQKILWPACLCIFRDATSTETIEAELKKWFSSDSGDFLGFAQDWLASAGSRDKIKRTLTVVAAQTAAETRTERAPRNHDHTDSIEGFARTPNYLDLPPGNTIYPTPPDGVQPQRLHARFFNDGAVETPAEAEEVSSIRNDVAVTSMNGDTSMDLLDDNNILMTRNNSVMATGLYDASDTEDFFGEMDGDQFDAKGLTEADFSFFDDEPGLGNLDAQDVDMKDANHSTEQDGGTAPGEDQGPLPPSHQISGMAESRTKAGGTDEAMSGTGATTVDSPQEEPRETSVASKVAEPISEQSADVNRTEKLPVSPPLSPYEVRRKMFSQNMPPPWSPHRKDGPKRKQSVFEAVDFGESVDLSDKKYTQHGKFSVLHQQDSTSEKSEKQAIESSNGIPTIGPPKRKRTALQNLKINLPPPTPSVDDHAAGVDRFDFAKARQAVSNNGNDSDSSLTGSESPPILVSNHGIKRKRPLSDVANESPSSGPVLTGSPVELNSSELQESLDTLHMLTPHIHDGSFEGYFSMRDNRTSGVLPVSNDNFPQLAQILVDQLSQTSLDHRLDGAADSTGAEERIVQRDYAEVIQTTLGEVLTCDLQAYSKIEGFLHVKSERGHEPMTKTQNHRPELLNGDIFKLISPYIRICRAKISMEVLPSVLSFWETFSLAPHSGPKNIAGLCLYPPTENAREGAKVFLDRLGDVYQSSGLGNHTRIDVSDNIKNSMIPWKMDGHMHYTLDAVMGALKVTCETLGMETTFLF